eukprot:1161002-Pelagomonas_calceolata.AAC.2
MAAILAELNCVEMGGGKPCRSKLSLGTSSYVFPNAKAVGVKTTTQEWGGSDGMLNSNAME